MAPKLSQVTSKRQGNVLDLLRKPKSSHTIDLTIDDDDEPESVVCPICNLVLDMMSMDTRVRHVEVCMSVLAIDELKEEEDAAASVSVVVLDIGEKTIKSVSKSATKKPKLDRDRYVNSSVSVLTEAKAVRVPTKIIQQKPHKRPIPQLKILTFPKLPSETFQVAVDAFSYSVHDSIDKYFLTHFHSDHYGGISRNWCFQRVFDAGETDFSDESKFKKIIYCTPITARLLSLKFGIDPKFIQTLEMDTRYLVHSYESSHLDCVVSTEMAPGLYVTPITANHCPGAAIFLMESVPLNGTEEDIFTILHCGDFRVSREILEHPLLNRFHIGQHKLLIDKVYLDTTYLDPDYSFPKQELVCSAVGDMFEELISNQNTFTYWFGSQTQSRITDFISLKIIGTKKKKKFLILVGTYLIGKERIAIALLKRLKCPIFVLCIHGRREKLEIIKSFDDEYLNENITMDDIGSGDCESQCMVHLVPMKIVSTLEEMASYFHHNKYFEHFEMCVGLKPSGWTFKNMYVKTETRIDMDQIMESMLLNPPYTFKDNILPQVAPVGKEKSGNKRKRSDPHYRIYTVPYSEHSSFRELCYFCSFLRFGEVIPTVNMEDPLNRERMGTAIETWELIRKLKEDCGLKSDMEASLVEKVKNLRLDSF